MVNELRPAIGATLSSPKRCASFYGITFLIFCLLILIPVWSTPGNDFLFQLQITQPHVMGLMILLSFGNSLLILMQYHIRHAGHKSDAKTRVKEGATLFGIIVSSLTATIACAACYSSILALFSLGTAAFLLEHQAWFAVAALLITFFALHHSARKVNHGCQVCKVKL